MVAFACAVAGAACAGPLSVVNNTGMNLPELPVQVELALGGLVDRVPAPVVVQVDLVEATNLRDRNIQPFPFSARYVAPRGYTNDWATLMVQGRVGVLPGGAARPIERRFIGRCAAWQDYDAHFAFSRAHRPFAGFLEYPGRLDPNGPLVVGAIGNAFAAVHLDRWMLGLTGVLAEGAAQARPCPAGAPADRLPGTAPDPATGPATPE